MALDYVTKAQGRLTNQFSEKPLIKALVGAMVTPLTVAEDVADQLKNNRWIASAVGVQLDGCGYIVGESRKARTDDEYRKAILFRIFVNTSNATPEDLIYGLKYLTEPDELQYIEQYPATAMLFTDGPNTPSDIHTTMQDLSPAAICTVPIMVSFAHAPPFRFSMAPDNQQLNVGPDTRLTANGNRISITSGIVEDDGARLGGIAPAFITANGSKLTAAAGRLRINSPNHQTIIESGYHLTGVYQ